MFTPSLTHRDHASALPTAALLRRIGIAAAGIVLVALPIAGAQARSGIALLASRRPMKIAVIGDSLANDLGQGMQALFRHKRNLKVIKETQFATGLVRTDYFNWNATVRHFLAHVHPNAMTVIIGGNDRQPIRTRGRRYDPMTRSWRIAYAHRVAHFMHTLERAHARVYWVGLPIVRSDQMTHDFRIMNRIFHHEAVRHHFTYVSIWNKFRARNGGYTSFGRTLRGVDRRLRKPDGMHFTDAGKLRLAADVARVMHAR